MVRLKSLRWFAVFGALLAAIVLVAPAVLAQSGDSATAFELVGNIDAMNSSSIAVHGQIIDIIGAEVSVALEVGLAVRVHGAVMPDGRIIASEVDAAQNNDILPGEVKIIGVWPAEVGSKVVIGGVIFDLTNAEIDSSLVAGDLAVVHATLSAEGTWVVREVKLFMGDDNDNDNADDTSNDNSGDNSNDNSNDNENGGASDEVELTGTLESIGDGFIIVSGANIDTRSAEIHGTLIVGTLVKVHVRVVNGNIIAREVELVSQDNSNDNADDNGNDNQNDNNDDNGNDNQNDDGNDNEDDSLPTIPGDCVASMPSGWTTYTIQPGDTLSSIAGRTGASLGDLMRANCIANPRMIVAGASIFVPRTPDPVTNSNDNANNNDNNDDRGNDNASDNGDDHGDDNGNDNEDHRDNDNRNDNGGDDDNDNRGGDDDNDD